MGGSRRFPPADVAARAEKARTRVTVGPAAQNAVCAAVADSLAKSLPNGGRVAIALSGGRDSIALLDAALESAARARCTFIALHIDHGLSVNANQWSRFCRETCAARGVPFQMRSVHVECGTRISIEAAARTARYAALGELAREHAAAAVMLAHHADDQAETTLLQLFRGAGPRGLAAMPNAQFDQGIWWLRPFLALPRGRLDDYVTQRALRYVDDDTNGDARYRRNALRTSVVPSLRAIAPGYPGTLVRAAELQAEAAALLDDLAQIDAKGSYDGATLDCAVVASVDNRRSRNLLRWFLRQHRLPAPSSARLAEIVRQLTGARPGARIAITHAGAQLGVHHGRIVIHRSTNDPFRCEWTGAEAMVLPHGTLRFTRGRGAGIAARHLAGSKVTIRSGVHGERLQIAGRTTRRQVADLLREAGVPRWDRLALPRIYCGQLLAAVAPLGVDAAFAAAPGEPAFVLEWQPAPSAH